MLDLGPIQWTTWQDRFWMLIDWIFEPRLTIDLGPTGPLLAHDRADRIRMETALEIADQKAVACMNRVKKRMELGDKEWIPPLHNAGRAYRKWRRHHPRPETNVVQIKEKGLG